MNHKNGFNPLSRTTAHRRAMSRNMVTSLFRFERITTTKSKALEVRKAAEKIITRGKEDTVHNRRQVAKFVQDEKILNKLFTDIGPRMKDRNGGYTRILKIGFRQGDAADMVILELVDYKLDTEAEAKKAEKKAAKAEKAAAPAEKTGDKTEASSKAKAKKEPAAKKAGGGSAAAEKKAAPKAKAPKAEKKPSDGKEEK
ncbi:50S ribosomal protein L17 [Treponema parvum]|uniref:Large ribosomal subunit protein bL17 n=1 Tax=Treponema parvum TaxID=138851 RepID=A0A975F130_9SPIR|nr:50S ribosomal protein L17 [Treponema parvum]QTQ12501.1 50S ribosomal protein L17 [Treponema parvum]QTQ15505.1 50S ribosomal protein L17 [Treponema parvum]